MPKSFTCPTCAAPLEFEGKMLQDCKYCGGNIIVPSDMFEKKPFKRPVKVIKLDQVLNTVLTSLKFGEQQNYVVDLRSSSKTAQQNIQNIHTDLQSGDTMHAVSTFTETFGLESGDAQNVVEAMMKGQGFDASSLKIYPNVKHKSLVSKVTKLVVRFLVLLVAIPIFMMLVIFMIAFFLGK